jgi:hypothetical protein
MVMDGFLPRRVLPGRMRSDAPLPLRVHSDQVRVSHRADHALQGGARQLEQRGRSAAHNSSAMLAVMRARPSASDSPGLSTPSRARRPSSGDPRTHRPLTAVAVLSTTTLNASSIGSKVNGSISSTARLLITVDTPHAAAAATSDYAGACTRSERSI